MLPTQTLLFPQSAYVLKQFHVVGAMCLRGDTHAQLAAFDGGGGVLGSQFSCQPAVSFGKKDGRVLATTRIDQVQRGLLQAVRQGCSLRAAKVCEH